ncbi:hypothetical protein ACFL6S_07455 [Candidatus Poribacteria bacterium]
MKPLMALMLCMGLAFMFIPGCGDNDDDDDDNDDDGEFTGDFLIDPTEFDETYDSEIDPADFVTLNDNPFFPLTPGTTFIYEGETEDGPERIEVEVTSDTRIILGVTCTVVRDRVWVDDELVEDTFDWYAQDEDGNIWYFGEDSTEFEDGVAVSTEGSWEGGVDGARPGILIEAEPEIGDAYRQEFYEGEAEDMAKVLSLSESVTVPYGSFDNCLQTMEWTPLEPDVVEQKFYARGVGFILEVQVEGGSDRAELVEIRNE